MQMQAQSISGRVPGGGLLGADGDNVAFSMTVALSAQALTLTRAGVPLNAAEATALRRLESLARRAAGSTRFFDSRGAAGTPPLRCDDAQTQMLCAAAGEPTADATMLDTFTDRLRRVSDGGDVAAAESLTPVLATLLRSAERASSVEQDCGRALP